MFCEKCGKEIPDDAVVCVSCGQAMQPIKGTPPQIDRQVKRANPGLLLSALIGGGIVALVGYLLFLYNMESYDREALAVFGSVLISIGVAGFAFGLVLSNMYIHRMWRMIQDGHARTTPDQAVGFLFVMFFNFYWVFQALWGWSKDYNSFIRRNAISDAPKMPEGLFLAWAILGTISTLGAISVIPKKYIVLLAFIPFCIIGLISTVKICKAINFFAGRSELVRLGGI